MNLTDVKKSSFTSGGRQVYSISGNVPQDDIANEMYMELYIIDAKSPVGNSGVIVIMSGYPLSEKAIFQGEGRKAVLSARVVQ